MELIDVIDKKQCTGCMACKNACPRNAITIKEDEKTGFLYPKINIEYCTYFTTHTLNTMCCFSNS